MESFTKFLFWLVARLNFKMLLNQSIIFSVGRYINLLRSRHLKEIYILKNSIFTPPYIGFRQYNFIVPTISNRYYLSQIYNHSLLSNPLRIAELSQLQRLKSSKAKRRSSEKDESSDEDTDDEDDWVLEKGPNFKDRKAKVPSLRLDAILKTGLGLSRNKVEETFYGNKVKVNKEKVSKKSQMLMEGDTVDVLKGTSSDTAQLELTRLKLLKVGEYDEVSDKFPVLIRKYPRLLLDNYKDDEEDF